MAEAEAAVTFDPERQALARKAQREALRRGAAHLALFVTLAWLLLPTGLTHRLEGWATSLSGNPWVVVALYVVVAYGTLALVTLPLRAAGRRAELRYGLTKQTWTSWLRDRGKAFGLGLLFALGSVEVLYWTVRTFEALWWVVFGAATTAFSLVAGVLAPVLLLPLFFPVRRVEDSGLVDRVQALCERAGVRVLGVYEFRSSAKTERGTAALAGLGRTRRILLSDHILAHFRPEEVEGVLAHELAHALHRDSLLFLALSALLALVGLVLMDGFVRAAMPLYGLEEMAAVATLPLFALFGALYYTASGPLFNAVSRRREAAADRRGAALCGSSRALATALVKLHDRNLAHADPHPVVEGLFYSHPAGRRRVKALLGERRG